MSGHVCVLPMRACACACVRARACVRVRAYAWVAWGGRRSPALRRRRRSPASTGQPSTARSTTPPCVTTPFPLRTARPRPARKRPRPLPRCRPLVSGRAGPGHWNSRLGPRGVAVSRHAQHARQLFFSIGVLAASPSVRSDSDTCGGLTGSDGPRRSRRRSHGSQACSRSIRVVRVHSSCLTSSMGRVTQIESESAKARATPGPRHSRAACAQATVRLGRTATVTATPQRNDTGRLRYP
jgi:hypothetical protein